MEDVRIQMGFDNGFHVASMRRSESLSVLWNNSTALSTVQYGHDFIDTLVEVEDATVRLTCFYGNPNCTRRMESWNRL